MAWKQSKCEKWRRGIVIRICAMREGVDTAGCASRRSSHVQSIPLGTLAKWPLGSLDIKNAFLQADGFPVLSASGHPRMIVGLANCGRPLTVFMVPQLHFVGSRANS